MSGGKIFIVPREPLLNGTSERCLIARSRDLLIIRQPGGIPVDRTRHSKRLSLAGHELGESVLVARSASATTTAASFAERVTMPLMASSTASVLPGFRPSLVGIWPSSFLGNLELAVQLEFAGFQLLEQQV